MSVGYLIGHYGPVYSGCWLNESNGPSCFGRGALGVRLARETALGSKLL